MLSLELRSVVRPEVVGRHTRGNEKCRQGERGETLFDADQQRSSRNDPQDAAADHAGRIIDVRRGSRDRQIAGTVPPSITYSLP